MKAVTGRLDHAPHEHDPVARRNRRLESFHLSCRKYVAELTSCSVVVEDLADSFPGLLFALVSGYASAEARERAFQLVSSGAPLREAAGALGLPWWLRKLPAQAFSTPLPVLPDDPEFALRISSTVPREADLAPSWLARVTHAHQAGGGAAYTLWTARQVDLNSSPDELFMYMAAWAWFGERPGLLGNRLLRRRWSPDMSFKRACEELAAWRQRLRLIECLGPGIESPWLADGSVAGFTFVALRTADDFITESQALENCLDQYADQLRTGTTAVFSIRKGARRIACVEIGLHDEELTMPNIVQLRAARNRRAPPEVWQAAFAWLGSQRLEPLSPERNTPKPIKRLQARRQLWDPYLEFLEGTPHAEFFRQAVLSRPGWRRDMLRRPMPATMRRPPARARALAAAPE